jgi:hypothetical protein
VHLTSLGSYYMAAVVFATMWGLSPEGAPPPAALDPVAVKSLQVQAWRFARAQLARPLVTASQCREQLRASFISEHWRYMRDTRWTRESGRAKAQWQAWRQIVAWHIKVRRGGAVNPFAD